MGVRGRKSSASQLVVVAPSERRRLEPPTSLNEEQAEVWRATVASEPVEFFGTEALRALLLDYVRHSVTAAGLSRVIDAFDVGSLSDERGLKRYDRLLAMRDRESRASTSKATKLRLTNQARYQAKTALVAGRHSASTRPWIV